MKPLRFNVTVLRVRTMRGRDARVPTSKDFLKQKLAFLCTWPISKYLNQTAETVQSAAQNKPNSALNCFLDVHPNALPASKTNNGEK